MQLYTMTVQLQSAIFLILQSLLGEDITSSLAPSAIDEANTAVTSVREEATAKKRGHYHHLSASMHKFTSEIFNFAQLVGVFKTIIAEILWPCKNSGLIETFSCWKFLAIQYSIQTFHMSVRKDVQKFRY